jgi:hypothetical protein
MPTGSNLRWRGEMSKFVGFKSVVGRITMAFVVVLPILA